MATDWREEHRILGCARCFFADAEAINKGPCCTFNGKFTLGPEGNCLTRRSLPRFDSGASEWQK